MRKPVRLSRASLAAEPAILTPLARASERAKDAVSLLSSDVASMNVRYRIQGGKRLSGIVQISGSKNAALPLIAATILTTGDCILRNVPHLRDTETMLSILQFLGATVAVNGTTVTINTDEVESKTIPHDLVSKLRGSIVLLGSMLARFGEVQMAYPGGCVLGKRSIDAHTDAFSQMGVENLSTNDKIHLKGTPKASHIVLSEFSVTATENALLAAAFAEGTTEIELAAAEPHVQDVCTFLSERGVRIEGIGSHTLRVHGRKGLLEGKTHTVTPDYLEAGVFLLAGIVTKGRVTLKGANAKHLTSFIGSLRRAGVLCKVDASGDITVDGEASVLKATRVQTNIFPGFPTDLQAPFGVLQTQATGVSRIFEVLFEGRMAYLYELEKMGASIEILNSHQALIIGPTKLQGRQVASNDIRAGAAMVLAGLCAEGETIVTDVQYIERGYDRLEEKLKKLGAEIVREEE